MGCCWAPPGPVQWVGALLVSEIRERLSPEMAVHGSMFIVGLTVLTVGLSRFLWLSMAAMALGGAVNMVTISMLNVGVQLSVPRWVAARALAWYQSSLTGGFAIGAAIWGRVTAEHGVAAALVASAIGLMLLPLLGLLLPMPVGAGEDMELVELSREPEVALALSPRSGPVVVEIDYEIEPPEARNFYEAMLQLQSVRLRNGAFDWSIARDIADAALWTERFHFPTWQDYLRQRTRFTQADRVAQAAAAAFNTIASGVRVRRRLERPVGSMGWQTDTPDPQANPTAGIYTP